MLQEHVLLQKAFSEIGIIRSARRQCIIALVIKGKKWDKDVIKKAMADSDHALINGLLKIYEMQTEDEKKVGDTLEDNNVGFNGTDGDFLSSCALQYMRKGELSPKQLAKIRLRMPKYAGQIFNQMVNHFVNS